MGERKRRHRWAREQSIGDTCLACGVFRLYRPLGGPRGGMAFRYEWPDGRIDTRPRDAAAPPCPGPTEKETTP